MNECYGDFSPISRYNEKAQMDARSKIGRGKSIYILPSTVISSTCLLILCQMAVSAAGTKAEMVHSLLQVLNKASVSGSMEIRGQCESGNVPEIPDIVQAGLGEQNILQTVRSMFVDHPAMQITQDQSGTIRMKELGVSDDILRVKVRDFHFADSQNGGVYAPDVAVLRVMVSPEVVSFRRSRKIEWVAPSYWTSSLGPPSSELPHVSGSMENMTVSEIFDRVLRTFPGMWVYENCPAHDHQKRAVQFQFFTFTKPGE